ncbi:MAG: hypothetical protein IJF78_02570 [Clostridia bacterium]|nr:hypothetical protein [Clostridia bacterium]
MYEILHSLIPVGLGIWILFFILPGLLSLIGQIILCGLAVKITVKLLPVGLAAVIILLVLINGATGILDFLIGGFIALLLVGTALFILGASLIGWLIHGIVKLFVKK